MRFFQTEYLVKGIFLGLIFFAGLLLSGMPAETPWMLGLGRFTACLFGGLGIALVLAALLKFRQGVRMRGRPLAFLLFLLLESSTLIYVGLLAGALAGLYSIGLLVPAERQSELRSLFLAVVGGSALVGLLFGLLRQVRHRWARTGLVLALAGSLLAVGLVWMGLIEAPWLGLKPYQPENRTLHLTALAYVILVSIPAFYLLTFSGYEEESEIEIGLICGLLGLALAILVHGQRHYSSLAFIVPLLLYIGYTIRVLPGLRVLKHAFRGIGFARTGDHRRALLAFRRALYLEPANHLAREGFWEVHRSLDLDALSNDPHTLRLVDLDLCLDRAGALLVQKPTPEQLLEANRLLDLVVRLQPDRQPQCDYWHAVAAVHGGDLARAADLLERILDPRVYGSDNPIRAAVHLPALQLALLLHPGLRDRFGLPMLQRPGRRMEAIAVVERRLAEVVDDADAIALKKLLYRDLTEAEYDSVAPDGLAAPQFDHHYAQHLGMTMIDKDEVWQRGGAFLRIAARGLPALGPTLFVQIAQVQRRMGLDAEARHNYELAKRAGQAVGPANLADAERQSYFATLKLLGDEALAEGNIDAAIENYRLYQESEQAGLATLRVLADLYEKKGDALSAARVTDQALQYNAGDPDLLARKAKYYFSIPIEVMQARREQYGPGFDVPYCLRESNTILDKYNDLEWLEVAEHLSHLALIVQPDNLEAKVVRARVRLRFGDRDDAIRLLEEVRHIEAPSSLRSGDQDMWYAAHQMLGDLYLEMDEPGKAVECLNEFRKSPKSGARTWYKLGQGYEALLDVARAKKCYSQAAAYDGNPFAGPAREALYRLGA
jgi:tetratricopeptide (TPR) repeat protein